MLDLPPVVAHATARGAVVVSVPEVATTATDGLARVLRAGRIRVSLPVLLAVPGQSRPAWLEVDGVRGPEVQLQQGQVAHVSATAVVRPGTTVSVRVVAGWTTVSAWEHRVGQ